MDEQTTELLKVDVSHDERGRVTKQEIYAAGSETAREYDYTYKPGRLESVLHALTLPNGTIEKPEYDGLGRTVETNTVLPNNDKLLGSRIYYLKNDDRTTGLVSTMRYSVEGKDTSSLKYTYDANGNIVQIKENGIFKARYAYDALNRLVREDNKPLNKTYTLTYDAGGNISARSERTFTLDAEVFGNTETLYSYKGDQLVAVNDNDGFVYDKLGNPTTYFGKTLAWGKVRQLNSITTPLKCQQESIFCLIS